MLRVIFAIFLVLHGLVHLLYLGQSARYFELQPGLLWPNGSWAFARLPGDGLARGVAALSLALAAIAFVAGGLGLLVRQNWWQPVVVGVAVFSTLLYILFWDGTIKDLDDKGVIAVLLNVAILAVVLLFHWPDL